MNKEGDVMPQEQTSRVDIAQRFLPYDEMIDNYPTCDASGCEQAAEWFDRVYDTFWCDVHARQEVAVWPRVRCGVCFEWYLPSKVKNGVCVTCPQ